jgi:hypothetical protein
MWLLSYIAEGKQHKILIQELDDMRDYIKLNKDIGFLIEYIDIFVKPSPVPKKESTSTRLIPLSDTTQKD